MGTQATVIIEFMTPTRSTMKEGSLQRKRAAPHCAPLDLCHNEMSETAHPKAMPHWHDPEAQAEGPRHKPTLGQVVVT
jgi:hypothetical protein